MYFPSGRFVGDSQSLKPVYEKFCSLVIADILGNVYPDLRPEVRSHEIDLLKRAVLRPDDGDS